ncbi:NADH dehydrogenase [ubiquinone] iron-sulfur protein 6, mitochondrial [Holothuria leucospilota]|uniref:NADH dehydrogenase [ubiquinone] iron-sulfur protein 6, mitochondrial n=1 Tax=Holothuria leucospilota TaxID=206669 RepID=A0A9Q1CA17_HOLLE|nr:NADH dehydrogenase [ubiquinone] iron-sulfur protein 6, mitochondrial [Holothuria leucospilota]
MALHRASVVLSRLQFNRVLTARSIFSASRLQSPEGSITHTGQAFDKDDYRAVRYIDREKEVNEKFAIDLVAEEPPTEIDGRSVWCDGGGGALGHPKVYINLDAEGPQPCGYCGLRFVQKHH